MRVRRLCRRRGGRGGGDAVDLPDWRERLRARPLVRGRAAVREIVETGRRASEDRKEDPQGTKADRGSYGREERVGRLGEAGWRSGRGRR